VAGSRLARRIIVPVLVLIGALFVVLGVAAVWIADGSVARELEETADRVAATLEDLHLSPTRREELLDALERLVGAAFIVVGNDPVPPGRVVLARRVRSRRTSPLRTEPEESIHIGFEPAQIDRRRREVLLPIVIAGAVGLALATLLGLVAARAIQDSEEQLKEHERLAALGRLASGVAHELRNPLTAIRMAVETGTEGEARTIAVAEIERLDRTLREMLDYVRPREPVLRDVDMEALLGDVEALLRPQCEHLGVRLEVSGGGTVRADYDRVKQALLNLVLNACHAQPHGGVVRLTAADGAVSVQDEGSGIPGEVRESLMQPFVTTKEAGIGLGLAVVKQVADEHGARLEFRTGSAGTTFTIRFEDV